MTIYTIEAIALTSSVTGTMTDAATVDIVVDISPNAAGNEGFYIYTDQNNYRPSIYSTFSFDLVHLNMAGTINSVTVDGQNGFGLFQGNQGLFYKLTWGGGYRTTVLYYNDPATRTEYFIGVEGSPLPPVYSIASGNDFANGFSYITGSVPLGYSQFDLVEFTDLLDASETEPLDIYGGFGNDTLTGTESGEFISAYGGDDLIYSYGGDDTIDGGNGNDSIYGGDGADSISGGAGDDYIQANLDDAYIDGGDGNDTIYFSDYSLSGLVSADLSSGNAEISGLNYTATNFENADIYLSSTNATLSIVGSEDDNNFFYSAGNSTVDGLGGNDTVLSWRGDDSLIGGLGDDSLDSWHGNDTLDGGAGNDTLVAGAGDDLLLGGADADSLLGGDGDDTLNGGAGNDTLDGGTGSDTVDGGDDDDLIYGSSGADMLSGGLGFDVLSYATSTSRIILDLNNSAVNFGDAVGDVVDGFEEYHASDFTDQLRGDAGDNVFFGGGVTDRLYGRAGDDSLNGEAGADAIYGNLGADEMTGGDDTARDRFIYFQMSESGVGAGNRDVITDFGSGEDRIEISRFDADITQGFKQRFDFVGDAAFSNTAGELRYEQTGGSTIVQADVNGDGIADFEIELLGQMDLIANDFLI